MTRSSDESHAASPAGYRCIEGLSDFEGLVGPIYIRSEVNDRRCAFVAESRHCNRAGVVHGGMLMAFADIAFASLYGLEHDEPSTSISFTFEMMKPAHDGDLVEARVRLLRQTGSLNFQRGELFVGDTIIVASSTIDKRLRSR